MARQVRFGAFSANARRIREVDRYSPVDEVCRVSVKHLRFRHISPSERAALNSCCTVMKRMSKRSATGCGFSLPSKHSRMYGVMRRYAQRSSVASAGASRTCPRLVG